MERLKTLSLISLAILIFTAMTQAGQGYVVGDKVETFTLKNVDGKMLSLSDYAKNKGVIVIFDCNTCPYSQAYNKRIIELNDKCTAKGFPVITINANDPKISPGDSFEAMQNQAKAKAYKFPYLFDETQEVAHAFGATNTPHAFVLEKKENDFLVAYIGAIDDSPRNAESVSKRYVENAIDALLAGTKIETAKTKAIGCTIKYR